MQQSSDKRGITAGQPTAAALLVGLLPLALPLLRRLLAVQPPSVVAVAAAVAAVRVEHRTWRPSLLQKREQQCRT